MQHWAVSKRYFNLFCNTYFVSLGYCCCCLMQTALSQMDVIKQSSSQRHNIVARHPGQLPHTGVVAITRCGTPLAWLCDCSNSHFFLSDLPPTSQCMWQLPWSPHARYDTGSCLSHSTLIILLAWVMLMELLVILTSQMSRGGEVKVDRKNKCEFDRISVNFLTKWYKNQFWIQQVLVQSKNRKRSWVGKIYMYNLHVNIISANISLKGKKDKSRLPLLCKQSSKTPLSPYSLLGIIQSYNCRSYITFSCE